MTQGESRVSWRLRTRATQYGVSLLPDGSGLVLDHWGEPAEVEPWSEPHRQSSYALPADVAPLEYASDGQRAVGFSELLLDRGEGAGGAVWTARTDEITFAPASSGDRLVVPFVDETGCLHLELRVETSSRHDVVGRGMTLRNRGGEPVRLRRAFSAAWSLPLGQRAHVDYLAGTWSHEFQRRAIDLDWGVFSMGSRHGLTGLRFSPVVTVTRTANRGGAVKPSGQAYGVALEWSGSWRLQVECAPVGQHVRVSCGIDEDSTVVTLLPGEEFRSPDSLGIFSGGGPEGVTRGWHDFARAEVSRDHAAATRPVVYNSWYATEFDVQLEHQKELASLAAGLGVEVFVIDDGWFVGRTSDRSGLGDWRPDPAKLPNGLAELAVHAAGLGMRFGIWVEPECVNPDSDLFRAHPDWIYRAPGREPELVRNQYVLDLGCEEVVSWVEDTLRGILSSADISYLKWDMNRPVSDGGRPGDPHGREWSLQHTRNYYRVLESIRREFPQVTVEACASGGARIDFGVLARSDVVWTSDEVGPVDRLGIQHGFLSAYPAWVMSSWVADALGHRDRRAVSLGYRFAVAMSGVLGIGGDLSAWTEQERSEAAAMVALYKQIRPIILHGDSFIHGDPGSNLYCIEFQGPDEDPRTVLLVFDRDRDRQRDEEQPRVYPQALREDFAYRLPGAAGIVTAAAARGVGIVVPFQFAPDADVLVLTPEEQA